MNCKLPVLYLLTVSSLNLSVHCMENAIAVNAMALFLQERQNPNPERRSALREIDSELAEILDLDDGRWDEIDECCARCCIPTCTLLSGISAVLSAVCCFRHLCGDSSGKHYAIATGGIAVATLGFREHIKEKSERNERIKQKLSRLTKAKGVTLGSKGLSLSNDDLVELHLKKS